MKDKLGLLAKNAFGNGSRMLAADGPFAEVTQTAGVALLFVRAIAHRATAFYH